MLDGLEVILIDTPWPVVMTIIVVMAYRLAGPRVAIFTAASLFYLAFIGLWVMSMITVALIGAGAFPNCSIMIWVCLVCYPMLQLVLSHQWLKYRW